MIEKLQTIFQPDRFQGRTKNKKYFEGWYYKIVNEDESKAFAFIPGVAMDKSGNRQAFIQVLDGKKRTAEYHKFNYNEFSSEKKTFEISIGENHFSNQYIELNLARITGKLQFYSQVPWPNSWYSPGIMGPYTFVPFMECYHGILSMNHSIKGELMINGEKIDFTNGRGYMEKDWGKSFPSAYFWMQSNHFSSTEISIKASVANIPWLGSSFVGFIAGIWIKNKLYQFTTYNGSKLTKSFANKDIVALTFENKNYLLDILAHREKATELTSPILGFMDGRIEESMTSEIDIILYDKKMKTAILKDTGRNSGLEVAGIIDQIMIQSDQICQNK